MPLRRKIGLALLMSMTIVTMVASIMKTVTSASAPTTGTDVQYAQSLGVLWAGIEQTFVIIMGCVPALRSFANLDFHFLRSISESLVSLLGKTRSRPDSHKSIPSDQSLARAAYYDLERNTHRLGRLHGTPNTDIPLTDQNTNVTFIEGGNTGADIGNVSKEIIRTDNFEIVYPMSREHAP